MSACRHDRGYGSKSMSSLLHCSTSKAMGIFHFFLLHQMSTMQFSERLFESSKGTTQTHWIVFSAHFASKL